MTAKLDINNGIHHHLPNHQADLIIIGSGLAGLLAAALVARQGRSVVVLEQARELGGRALTNVKDDVFFNLGPRALYCHGHAFRLLRDLNVSFSGRFPNPGDSRLWIGNQSFTTPQSLWSLLQTRLLTFTEKLRLFRLLSSLPKLDPKQFDGVTVAAWVEQTAGQGNLALFLRAFLRLVTYVNDPECLSAGAALEQLKLSFAGNVWYLDHGWQSLIDGLKARASASNVILESSVRATSIEPVNNDANDVQLADGRTLHAKTVLLTTSPQATTELLQLPPENPLAQFATNCAPSYAACLDVALERLPLPDRRFALGLDQPYYFSVHSAAAELGPQGVAVLHVMKYLRPNETTSSSVLLAELEGFLDRTQPGWRSLVRVKRFLPHMTVAHAAPLASEQGLAGRPPVNVADHPSVFVAGDWVGQRGMLADASAASAEEAAQLVLQQLAQSPARSLAHAG